MKKKKLPGYYNSKIHVKLLELSLPHFTGGSLKGKRYQLTFNSKRNFGLSENINGFVVALQASCNLQDFCKLIFSLTKITKIMLAFGILKFIRTGWDCVHKFFCKKFILYFYKVLKYLKFNRKFREIFTGTN